ncbi:bifunctional fructose-bisphosphatase/inositol-phosphate phosphatase [Methanoregula sp.]|uniref:bifunctional fructose-bisphosphatase/inositol-phosphate phosphatase n=1 Tax=Methanoregula sp. TaxID=2052170 RepID=UPI002C8260BF|nr:bifunctional fructose-bisphosphatase/inositol-phosphate phosphatase [Methanoregula sp.]HVP96171.1 bifunctional fructose-bisphosphatase/inositol-phosphate phosphatase [Methanoregula sp.]
MNFLSACTEMAAHVRENIRPFVASPAGGEIIRMGADRTPTERIDQVAEDCIIGYIRDHGLCSKVISEEAGKVPIDGGKGTIFLDPVDGTYNAVTGIPFYALSLAWAQDGIIRKAFVQDLATGETFTAVKGKFAHCNGKSIHVSSTARLDKCAMSIYGRKFDPTRMMQLGHKIRRWRLLGASALELCYVGAGRIDGFVDLRGTLRVTDAAAGMLICTEAGGSVSDINGDPLEFPEEVTVGRCIVATNSVLHHKVVEYLR